MCANPSEQSPLQNANQMEYAQLMGPGQLRGGVDDVRKSHELLKKRHKNTEFKDESSQGTESYHFNKSYGTNDLSKLESMVRIS